MISYQNPDMPLPWMEGSKDINDQEMIVVHMSHGELEGLDNMQGGPSLDPDTGIREYSALGPIIEIPEVREVFKHVTNEIEEKGELSPDLHKVYEFAREHSLPYESAPEERHDPLKEAEHTGRDGDDKFALIPLNLALFLIELKHEPSINPKTGLLEFGFFKGIRKGIKKVTRAIFHNPIRTAGTIIGGMLGGPAGAGIGNTFGSLASGNSLKKSLKTGLMVGGAGYGLQGIGQASGLLGGAPNLIAKGLGSLGIGQGAQWGQSPKLEWGQTLKSPINLPIGSELSPQMIPNAPQQEPGFMDTIGNFMTKAAPFAPLGVTGLAYAGSKQHQKHHKKTSREGREYLEHERERMGFYDPLPPMKRRYQKYNPKFAEQTELERRYGIFNEPAFIEDEDEQEGRYAKGGLVRSYKKGTLVTGPGKGQDDEIKTSVPDGSYIIDASSTSMFGDGSSKAGSDVLKEFENHIKSKSPKKFLRHVEKQVAKTTSQVPVWLSQDEFKFDPVTVTLLGKGSNTQGAARLKDMVINLRKHKVSKGHGLPPKAKHPMQYISI
jgi:hypothetical protein